MNQDDKLREFFRRYALASLGPEPEKVADCYETSFLAAGPKGGAAFRNDNAFLSWLREVHAFNARTGMTSMTAGEIDEMPVGGGYTLATVEWAATFQRRAAPIRFRISYLLRWSDEGPKVAAYISHEDQEDAMRANGLL